LTKLIIVSVKVFFILFLIVIPSFSQEVINDSTEIVDHADLVFDSLITKLNAETIDTSKVNIINKIAWEYAPTNFEKSKRFADSALTLSKEINWEKGKAFALKNIGEALRYNGRVEESLEKFEISLNIFRKLNLENEIARVYNDFGLSYRHLTELTKSFEFHSKALSIYEKRNDLKGIIKVYTYLGNLVYQIDEIDKALNYYQKALNISNEIKNRSPIATLNYNIGTIYRRKNEYSKALKYYRIANKKFKELNDLNNYSNLLGNIGNLYLRKGDYGKALFYCKKALEFNERMEDKNGIAYQNANLGEIKYTMVIDSSSQITGKERNNLIMESIDNLKISSSMFDELGNRIQQMEDLILLSKVYKENGNYFEAFNTLEEAKKLDDSLKTKEVNKAIEELEFQKNLEIKEKEIEILNKDNSYQKNMKGLLIGFAVFLILFLCIIVYLYNSKHKRIYQLEEDIKQRKEAEEALVEDIKKLNKSP